MAGRDEIIGAIEGTHEGGAPPAVFTQSGTCAQMDACGRHWPQANWDPDAMAELALQLSRSYGIATARVPFSITSEAETLGCPVDPGTGSRQPSISGPAFSFGGIPDLPVGPEEFPFSGTCGRVLGALERIDREKEDVFLVAGMVDPMFLAMNLLGAETFLLGTIEDPGGCRRWVDSMVPYLRSYGKALSERSDCVMMICSAGTDLLSPDIIEEMVFRQDREVFGSMRESFGAAHSCGRTEGVFKSLASLGEDVISVVTDGDPEWFLRNAGETKLLGGANPVRDLLQGDPASIASKAGRYSDMGYALIGPECGVPPMVPDANLAALAGYRRGRADSRGIMPPHPDANVLTCKAHRPGMADLPDIQTTEEGREYEKNIMMVLSGEKKDYPSYFGGFMIASGAEFDVVSPIDDTIRYGRFQAPEDGIMLEAVTSAVKTQKDWCKIPSAERASYFEMPLKTIRARRLFYAASLTVATGMAREDALLEVDRLAEIMEKAIGDGKAGIKGEPTGVWAVISAHNSPLAAPAGYAVAAMIAGNAVILNPSQYCPSPLYQFYSLTEKAGLPGGVLNLITDTRDKTTDDLANDMRVAGVVATGSGERLEDLMFLQVDDELGFINEIKGMNPAIVYRPSDMKAAARAVAESAFAYSGQRPFSCSKVIVTADDQRKFMDALSAEMGRLKISDPVNDTTFSGPVISREAEKAFRALLAQNAGYIVARAEPADDAPVGPYVPFAVFAGLEDGNELGFMDSGFPVLAVKVVGTLDDAFLELEDTECGLSAGIFTKDQKAIDRFMGEADVPLKYVNRSSRTLAPGIWAETGRFTKRSA